MLMKDEVVKDELRRLREKEKDAKINSGQKTSNK
jgi:hypothetical protein